MKQIARICLPVFSGYQLHGISYFIFFKQQILLRRMSARRTKTFAKAKGQNKTYKIPYICGTPDTTQQKPHPNSTNLKQPQSRSARGQTKGKEPVAEGIRGQKTKTEAQPTREYIHINAH